MKLSFLIASLFLLLSCADNKNSSGTEKPVSENQTTDLQAGGLYLIKNNDNTYSLAKILVLDDFAVHLRIYQDTFKTKPTDINTEKLKIFIGHSPIDKNGFLLDKPELLKVEEVKESELEGYKMYQEAMEKQ
ncbi:MAG TPA: hypothetical protein VF476_07575 [Chitinophagaceae bacterium]